MAPINIKFGYPTSTEEQERLSERAIANGCSLEYALCFEFERLLDFLATRKGEESFFDLVFLVISEKSKTAPKVSFGTYCENGYKLPMVVLEDEYLMVGGSERLFITNKFIDSFGEIYQTEFDYEYVGLERVMS